MSKEEQRVWNLTEMACAPLYQGRVPTPPKRRLGKDITISVCLQVKQQKSFLKLKIETDRVHDPFREELKDLRVQ